MMKGEWRIAIGFLEGSVLALPKILGTSEDVPSSITENFFGASGDAPSSLVSARLKWKPCTNAN
jgi:hypothetical protein